MLDLSAIGRVLDNPLFRQLTRIATWGLFFVGSAGLGWATNQLTTVQTAQRTMFDRQVAMEQTVGSIQSTQSDRAADNEQFQKAVLTRLDGISNDVVSIRINQASVNTLLKEHYPGLGANDNAMPYAAAAP